MRSRNFWQGQPRATAAAFKNPIIVCSISGSSSKNASWPLSLSISTKLTLAPAAFSAHQRNAFAGRKQPVAGERHHTKARLGVGKGIRQRAAKIGGEVEIIHRAGNVEIAVGVKPVDKTYPLMSQIAFNLEVSFKAIVNRSRSQLRPNLRCRAPPTDR